MRYNNQIINYPEVKKWATILLDIENAELDGSSFYNNIWIPDIANLTREERIKELISLKAKASKRISQQKWRAKQRILNVAV